MRVFILTDMEGVAGIDSWDQCYGPHGSEPYEYGRLQLTLDVQAAVEGCFEAGAKTVMVLDGHGHNKSRGLFKERMDPRVLHVGLKVDPVRLDGLDEGVNALLIVGQHARAGTENAFLDHTQSPKNICAFRLNGVEIGEIAQAVYYAHSFRVPCVYLAGDAAACAEAEKLVPGITTTIAKDGTGWSTVKLRDPSCVRSEIRADVARALKMPPPALVSPPSLPATMELEFSYSKLADDYRGIPGVVRPHARTILWKMGQLRNIYTFPTPKCHNL